MKSRNSYVVMGFYLELVERKSLGYSPSADNTSYAQLGDYKWNLLT